MSYPDPVPQSAPEAQPWSAGEVSPRLLLPAVLLCFFLGVIGVHRFYVGKIGTGVLMILTLGGLGLWTLIDFVVLIVGSFKDKEGRYLKQWT
ncbi:TM2 domain-containing protein [Cellulomonas edaphi]|uniref:TM2 domain-containing protein n=1 Tax=Cellulomonas edaphi TaxID=3053468 RepID=A0ABT7S598_9CELL|nr:TM2 domain-containing protein [Cellulomons edaphi]MDM7830751.1 TM2 domain-containing protein [Cellulomons edaphi]